MAEVQGEAPRGGGFTAAAAIGKADELVVDVGGDFYRHDGRR